MTARPRLGLRLFLGLILALCLAVVFSQLLLWRALEKLAGDAGTKLSYQRQFSWAPGKLRLSALTLENGTAWRVEARSAQAQLSLTELWHGRLGLSEIRLDDIGITGRAGGWRLSDGLQLEAAGLSHAGSRFELRRVRLTFAKSTIALGQTSLSTVSGAIETGRASLGARVLSALRTRLRCKLRGTALGATSLRRPEWTLNGLLALEAGHTVTGTLLVFRSADAWVRSAPGFVLEAPSGGELRAFASAAGAFSANLQAKTLRLVSPGVRPAAALELTEFHVEDIPLARWWTADAEPSISSFGAKFARLSGTAWPRTLHFRLAGRVTLADPRSGSLLDDFARLELSQVRADEASEDTPAMSGRVDFEPSAASGNGAQVLAAQVQLSGPELRALTSLLTLPERVELTLSPFLREPFAAHASWLSSHSSCLRDVSVQASTLSVSGFLRLRRAVPDAALLFRLPIGAVAVRIDGAVAQARIQPSADWLQRQRSTNWCSND